MSREVRRSALVMVPIERMFEVIDRVEDYPAFLPWCVATHDIERSEQQVAATVEVGWKHLHFKVRTRNPKTPPSSMEIHLEDGSFRHFSGRWDLKPLGTRGCRVEFLLSYELSIPGAAAVAGAAIDHAADRMVDAFLARAESVVAAAPDADATETLGAAAAATPGPVAPLPPAAADLAAPVFPPAAPTAAPTPATASPIIAAAAAATAQTPQAPVATEPERVCTTPGACQDAPPAPLPLSRSTADRAERF